MSDKRERERDSEKREDARRVGKLFYSFPFLCLYTNI